MAMGARMVGIEQAISKAATLTEAQTILAQLREEEQQVTDTFFTQEATIASMQEMLKAQDREVTYISPPAPTPQRTNYILYAAIGLAALIIFKKVKL